MKREIDIPDVIEKEYRKLSCQQKKAFLRKHMFMLDADDISTYLNGYADDVLDATDPENFVPWMKSRGYFIWSKSKANDLYDDRDRINLLDSVAKALNICGTENLEIAKFGALCVGYALANEKKIDDCKKSIFISKITEYAYSAERMFRKKDEKNDCILLDESKEVRG